MAVTYSGVAANAGTSITSMPTHAVGNIIVIYAVRYGGSSTPPTAPSAGGTVPTWTIIDNSAGFGPDSGLSLYASVTVAYTIATASNHTSGTWTNAGGSGYMAAVVLSGPGSSPVGGHGQNGSAGSATLTAPAVTLTATDGSSAILEFYWTAPSSWNTPSGYTSRFASTTTPFMNILTKNSTTSDGSAIGSTTGVTTTSYVAHTLEIVAPVAGGGSSGAFFALF